jgi:hypothetical protein
LEWTHLSTASLSYLELGLNIYQFLTGKPQKIFLESNPVPTILLLILGLVYSSFAFYP